MYGTVSHNKESLLYQNSTTFKIPTSTLSEKHQPREQKRSEACGLSTEAQRAEREGAGGEVGGGK